MKSYNYNLVEKKVWIEGREYIAHMLKDPKQHSVVDGIVYYSWSPDNNGWNQYVHWHSKIYILPKGSKKWKMFYSGDEKMCPLGVRGIGIFAMLHGLESVAVREKIEVENEIREIEEEIEALSESLKSARKKYDTLKKKSVEHA